ncbi:MAG: GNAT family N-acetyltransferase [bacterium]
MLDAAEEVVGYYTLAPHVVDRGDVQKKASRGAPDRVPSILLARLALAEHLQGQGHGGELLAEALDRALDGIRRIGGRVIVVDAIDDRAASFYEHHGFKAKPMEPRRLFTKASDAARTLGEAWP